MPSGSASDTSRAPLPSGRAAGIARTVQNWRQAAGQVPRSRYVLFLAIAAIGCGLDLLTKSWMFERLGMPPSPVEWVWPGVFGFQTSLNEGALFGIGQGKVWLFATLSILAAAAIVFWLFVAGAARCPLLTVALACIMAGVLGNLYDRLGLPGLQWSEGHAPHAAGAPVYAVRDWVLVMIGRYTWPNFNIADSLLVAGAALLGWHAWRHDPDASSDEAGGER